MTYLMLPWKHTTLGPWSLFKLQIEINVFHKKRSPNKRSGGLDENCVSLICMLSIKRLSRIKFLEAENKLKIKLRVWYGSTFHFPSAQTKKFYFVKAQHVVLGIRKYMLLNKLQYFSYFPQRKQSMAF